VVVDGYYPLRTTYTGFYYFPPRDNAMVATSAATAGGRATANFLTTTKFASSGYGIFTRNAHRAGAHAGRQTARAHVCGCGTRHLPPHPCRWTTLPVNGRDTCCDMYWRGAHHRTVQQHHALLAYLL